MNWKRFLLDYGRYFAVTLVLVTLDQATKEWVRTTLMHGEILRPDLWLTQYARIMHWRNTGAAFGMFQDQNLFFMILGIIVSGIILYYFPQVPRQEWSIRLALSLMLAGSLGNLIDRIIQGHVTDFLSVGNFPVFNIADSSISTGVALMLLSVWLLERRQKKIENASELSAEATQFSDAAAAPVANRDAEERRPDE